MEHFTQSLGLREMEFPQNLSIQELLGHLEGRLPIPSQLFSMDQLL